MITAKLIESIDRGKFLEARIVVNENGETGVCFILTPDLNSGITVGDFSYDITSIEVYESYFTINYTWTKIQFTHNPTQEEDGERSLDVDIDRFGPAEGDIDAEAMAEYYYYEIWEYLEAYVQPDYL